MKDKGVRKRNEGKKRQISGRREEKREVMKIIRLTERGEIIINAHEL